MRRHHTFSSIAIWSRLVVAATLLLAVFATASAQTVGGPDPRFATWNTRQGLPQNSVRNIAQTPDGYLWLTTTDGLARFDGTRFKTFKRSNTPILPSNRLAQIFVDDKGVIWVLTEDARSVIAYSGGKFSVYRQDIDFKADDVREPFRARRDMRFRHGEDEYVFRGGRFVVGPVDHSAHKRTIAAELRNRWILAGGKRFAFGSDDKPMELSDTDAASSKDKSLKTVYSVELESGTWFLFPVRNISFLCRFKDGVLQAAKFEFDYRSVLGSDSSGNLWVGDYDKRLTKISSEELGAPEISDIAVELAFDADSENASWVSSIFKDRDQNLWIGTDRGLLLLKDDPLVSVYSVESGLPSNNIYAVTEDRDGTIWFGAWEFDLGNYRNGQFAFEEVRIVSSLLVDRAGRLWAGYNRGVQYRDNGGWTLAVDIGKDMAEGNSTFLFEDSEGAVWIGGTKALVRYKNGEKRRFTKDDGLPAEYMTAMIESREGGFWAGTSNGLARYEDGRWRGFTEEDGMSSGFIRALYEDDEGVLWIGTYDMGLMRFKDGRFVSIQNKDGLHGDGVFCILEDQGWFWISNNQGIFRVRRKALNDFADGKLDLVYSAAYGPGDGLENVEANGGRQPTAIKASDGRMWFATAGGLAVIDPKDAYDEADPPAALIEEITIDQDQSNGGSGEIIVDPTQRSIEINYTAFDYMYAEGIRFRYKLEGLDDAWTNAGTRRTAYFSHLPYGDYTFRVAAANRNGVWDEEGASIRIFVARPFYRTNWFYSLMVLAAVGIFAAVYLVRVRQLKALNEARAEFTKRLIETQEGERRRIALELHDSIGQSLVVIRNRALIGLGDSENKDRVLDQMQEISDASAEALRETRAIAHNLHPYQIRHLGLPAALSALAENVAAVSGIEAETDIDESIGELPEDTAINLYRIAQECLNNVVKHSEAQNVSVALRKSGESLVLSIADDGKGFDPAAKASGLGLGGIRERVGIIGGTITVSSLPGDGTSVTVTVPIKQENDDG